MIIKVETKDANLPYIAKGTLKATGENIMLKLSLQVKPKAKPSKYTNQIFTWVGIAGGILAVFICIVIIVHIIQVRSLKRKLQQAAAAGTTKTNDQVP
jgi:flagellar biosynthesis/type III secretory pathway M-ring protein FliF/YscJ